MSSSVGSTSTNATAGAATATVTHDNILEDYQAWCRSAGVSDVIQYRGITTRVEKYLSHRVEQRQQPGNSWRPTYSMTWSDLKILSRKVCAAIDEKLQLGKTSAIKALFEIKIKNHCWKLSNKYPLRTEKPSMTVDCSMEEDGIKHSLVKDSDADSFDEHSSKMDFYAFAGIASKVKMSAFVPLHFTDPPGAGSKKASASSTPAKKNREADTSGSDHVQPETGGSGTKRKSDAMVEGTLDRDEVDPTESVVSGVKNSEDEQDGNASLINVIEERAKRQKMAETG